MSKDAAEGPGLAPARERLGHLFEVHAARLYRLARRLTSNADDALDLVQDTFVKVARSSSTVPKGPTAEEAWLVRALVNLRRDQWRKVSVRRRLEPLLATEPETTPEPAYVRRLAVWQALDALSPRRRAVLVMHELEGLDIPAIASLLGVTAITVRWHLARARHELAARLRIERGAPDEHTDPSLAERRPAGSRNPARP